MSNDSVKQELVKKGEIKNFPSMLELHKAEVSNALPRHLRDNVDRYARLALTAFRLNPRLAECDPRSVFAGVILASQLGLELNVMGQAYLVPYKNHRTDTYEAQFIPGWKGYVDLVHRSGRAIVWTGCVFEGDEFSFMLGDTPYVKHRPMGEDDEQKITHTYAIGRVKGIDWPIVEVWQVDKVKRHRDRVNKVGKNHYSFDNWEMYARKVPLLQVIKYLPASVELSALVSLDHSFDTGRPQDLTIDAVAEGLVFPTGEPTKSNGATKDEVKQETVTQETVTQEPAKQETAEPKKEETKAATKKKAAAEKKEEPKQEPIKEEPKAEPITPEVVEPETQEQEEQEEVQQQAAPEQELADDLPPEQPAGKTLRGVTFPADLTGGTKHTNQQMDTAKSHAERLSINLAVFVKKRLDVEVAELNKPSMDKLNELLGAVSG